MDSNTTLLLKLNRKIQYQGWTIHQIQIQLLLKLNSKKGYKLINIHIFKYNSC